MRSIAALAMLILSGALTGARATTMEYVFSLRGAGILNGVSFSDAGITLTGTGDAGNVSDAGGGFVSNPLSVLGVEVTGVGSDIFAPGSRISSGNQAVLLSDGQGYEILLLRDQTLAGYGLAGAIGPVAAASSGDLEGFAYATKGGSFTISNLTQWSFSAVEPASVPEPGSAFVVAVGAAVIGLRRVRRNRPTSSAAVAG